MNAEERFETLVEEPGILKCQKCQSAMQYQRRGVYVCTECGWEYVTQFGKVKRYIDEHGPSTALQISQATGVSRKMIDEFLRERRIEPTGGR